MASYSSGFVLRFSLPIDPNFPGVIDDTGSPNLVEISIKSCNLYAEIGRIGAEILSIRQ